MTPEVSVVMGVYNGERYLSAAVESVLAQRGVDLELVVVDDGSTDGSGALLSRFAARDPRVRVLRQENRGLTDALRRGGQEARGDCIARHDADDLSHPDRLRRQCDVLRSSADTALVTAWTEFIGPGDETLGAWEPPGAPEDLVRGLRAAAGATYQNIPHGTAVFRRADYGAVGGYRAEFSVAQDIDLWLRLTERGSVRCVPERLYRRRILPSSLSTQAGREQAALAAIARALAQERARGGDESALLGQAAAIRPASRAAPASAADGYYFIGKCLLDRRDPRAVGYFRESLRRRPLGLRAWVGLCSSLVNRA